MFLNASVSKCRDTAGTLSHGDLRSVYRSISYSQEIDFILLLMFLFLVILYNISQYNTCNNFQLS